MNGDGGGHGGDPQLPQDVWMQILKRLPVKLLLQLRCVSSTWRSAIDQPDFAALHSRHSARDASNWYLVCLDHRSDFQDTCSLVPYDSLSLGGRPARQAISLLVEGAPDNCVQLRVETPFVTPPPHRFRFVGSCNGLIGVAGFSGNCEGQYMHLWNLFTRKHKAVRLFPRPEEPRFLSKVANSEFLGFGFDRASNDYKIMRILHFHVRQVRVGIYSLHTDFWRSLECEVPAFRYDEKPVFLNGKLHWVAFKLDDTEVGSKDASLFVFDLVHEVFDEMALPEVTFHDLAREVFLPEVTFHNPARKVFLPEETFQNKSGSLKVSVAVLNESLTVSIGAEVSGVNRYEDEDEDRYFNYFVCSVWVMRDYGLPLQEWTKLYTFFESDVVERFYGWMCDELLMEISSLFSENRISWNRITKSSEVLPLLGTTDLVPVVENLVSPEI